MNFAPPLTEILYPPLNANNRTKMQITEQKLQITEQKLCLMKFVKIFFSGSLWCFFSDIKLLIRNHMND